jgi:Ca2+-binding EF-hand superfamily protein
MKLITGVAALILISSSAWAQSTPAAGGLEERFRRADRDGDGRLSAVEARQDAWFVDEMQRFETVDRDKSGTVTLAEIGEAIAAQVSDWLSADDDKDGRVSADEAKRKGSLSQTFGNADADRDGMVTREEIDRLSQRSYYRDAELPAVAPNIIEKRF